MDAKDIALNNLVFQVASGSTAYGLNTKDSDVDRLGAFIPKPEQVFGLNRLEHYRGSDEDENYKTLPTFIEHTRGGSSFWVETLFVEPQHVLVMTEYFEPFVKHRRLFLTEKLVKKSKGFMDGMIKRSQSQQKLGDEYKHLDPDTAARMLAVLKHKQMCHAVRVGRMILEMYENLDLRVYRADDRQHLLDIKQGVTSLEDAYQEAEELLSKIKERQERMSLPEEADMDTLNKLIVSSAIRYWWDQQWI